MKKKHTHTHRNASFHNILLPGSRSDRLRAALRAANAVAHDESAFLSPTTTTTPTTLDQMRRAAVG